MDNGIVIAKSDSKGTNGLPSRQGKPSSRQLEEVKTILSHFEDFGRFLTVVNPDTQTSVCGDVKGCYTRDFPTLGTLNRAYTSTAWRNPAASWLVPQLTNLCEFCGVKDKLTNNQLRNLAEVIAMEYPYLKTSEMMLFFHRFKLGKYGRFYGSIDPITITNAMIRFMDERHDMLGKIESEKRAEKEEEDKKGCVSYQEWCRMIGRDPEEPITVKLGR